jgi:N-acetyl-gamma-glutamyl-phosphate reductase
MKKLKIGVIGATGYTGSELMRILVNHPNADIKAITSESYAGRRFSDVHIFFKGIADHTLITLDAALKLDLDVVFLALPHGVSMDFTKPFLDKKTRVIDLSGDFRLKDPTMYQEWYHKDHSYKEGFNAAVYGLPELNHDQIKSAQLVANPGCYPTTSILATAPLVKNGLVEAGLIIDAKSGITGAGIKAKGITHFSNVNDNFKAYALKVHRHTIEIEHHLGVLSNSAPTVQFTPHLLPVDRGILATCYAKPAGKINRDHLKTAFSDFYKNAPFIRLVDELPAIKDVRGTNYCNIYVDYDQRTDRVITISVIDNLVKGAAGQAVHNMNIMFDLEVTTGLHLVPFQP